MSPRSSNLRIHRSLLAFAAALVLMASAAPGVDARTGRRVTVRKSAADTVHVQEITIDDQGIRVIGSGTNLRIPGDKIPGVDVSINGEGMQVLQIGNDSLNRIIVHGRGDNEIVQFFKDITVERGEHTGDVVALFGNVKNYGTIGGDCVAIMGSIEQGDSALILGDAVTIGGALRELGQGARVEGQTVSIGFLPFAGFAVPSVPLLLFFGLFAYVLFVALAALFARLFPERLVRISETISRRTFLSLVLGLLSGPLALMVGLLLLVTVIGIPLALLLPMFYMLAAFIGYVAAAYLLGLKLLRRRAEPGGGMLAPIAVGTGFITMFFLLGMPLIALEGGFRVVGFSLLALWLMIGKVCWILGMGALLLSRMGQENGAKNPAAGSASEVSSPPAAPPLSSPAMP